MQSGHCSGRADGSRGTRGLQAPSIRPLMHKRLSLIGARVVDWWHSDPVCTSNKPGQQPRALQQLW